MVAAAARLQGIAHRTPVLTSRRIDAALGASLFFKCENLQRAGAFKFRGACNALSRLDEAQRRRGVAAYSSGNHAQAVAYASRLLGIDAGNAAQVVEAGADGVAVISALSMAKDPAAAARGLRDVVDRALTQRGAA